jgi:hypothetical protein
LLVYAGLRIQETCHLHNIFAKSRRIKAGKRVVNSPQAGNPVKNQIR